MVEISSDTGRTQESRNFFLLKHTKTDGMTWQVFLKTEVQLMGVNEAHGLLATQLGEDLKSACLFQNSRFGIAFLW